MSEIGSSGEYYVPFIDCTIEFEFDDPRFFKIPENNATYKIFLNWQHSAMFNIPPNLEVPKCIFDFNDLDGNRTGKLGIGWSGDPRILTDKYAVEQATVSILGLLRDCGYSDVSFTSVNLKIRQADDIENQLLENKDVTKDARIIELEFMELDHLSPSKFEGPELK